MNPAAAIQGGEFVVTGGCGFIGARVVSALLDRGAAAVRVIDHLKSGRRDRLPADRRVDVVEAAVGDAPVDALERALRGARGAFHLAAEKHRPSLDSARDLVLTNVLGTRDVIEAARAAGVSKLVFSSSLYAYGRTSGGPMVETEALAPRTLYGVTKAAGEQLVNAAHVSGAIAGVVLRYFFAYGPRQHAGAGYKSVIVVNFERLLRGERPVVNGDGAQTLDYTYVDEIAEATVRAMERPIAGTTINVGSGTGVSVRALTDAMLRVAASSLEPAAGPADDTAGSIRVADVERCRALLGLTPAVTLDDGLRRTWEWMKATASAA